MAKEPMNPMGLDVAELNALMTVQVKKLDTTLGNMKKLLQENHCDDFATAYEFNATRDFLNARDAQIDELRRIVDVMEKLRAVQNDLLKKGDKHE